jgi:hypothetical protein
MSDDVKKPEVEETETKDVEREAAEKAAAEENKSRSGVGTRLQVGRTRGKASLVIKYEAFDESMPDTLPKAIQEFMDVTKTTDQDQLVKYLIEGFNALSYQAASDPLAEFVNYSWPTEAQGQFRIVVRQYSRGVGVTLEQAVSLIKPGFDKQYGTA